MPLKEQDARLWSRDMIIEAEIRWTIAARASVFGRYPCAAAIQSVHAQRPNTGQANHAALTTLCGLLATRCPSIGVLVGQAAAVVEGGEPAPITARLIDRFEPAPAD